MTLSASRPDRHRPIPRRRDAARRHAACRPMPEALEGRTLLSGSPQLLADINQLTAPSSPSLFTAVGPTTFFTADDGVHGRELWRTDGSAAKTVLVKDINPGAANSNIGGLTALGGKLLFFADDGTHGRELWSSDGTTAGTNLVKDINPGTGPSVSNYGIYTAVLSGKVFFQANDGAHGYELWSSDGTAAGTNLVKDIDPGTDSSYSSDLTAFKGKLYFSARDATNGFQLWQSDGTAAGTNLVKVLNPKGDAFASALTPVGGTLYFAAVDGTDTRFDHQLWRTDGTADGTSEVTVIPPPPPNTLDGGNVEDLVNVNGTVYFIADNNLWKSDGTAAGTSVVSPAAKNILGYLTPLKDGLAFEQFGNIGRELWATDGTAAGTHLVKAIDKTFVGFTIYPTNHPLATLANKLYFAADAGNLGPELWRTDGTVAGTNLVKDINPNDDGTVSGGSNPYSITAVNGRIFFGADDGSHGAELWTSLGKASSTVLVKDINAIGAGSNPTQFVGVGSSTFFVANDGVHGQELDKTDGTTAGTALLKDINPGGADSMIGNPIAFNGKLLFRANDGVNGAEPWISDGTTAGTTLLKDINPGTNSNYGPTVPNNSFPSGFTLLNGRAIFSAYDGVNGDELWETDGTAAGTTLIKDIFPGTYFYNGHTVGNNSYPGSFTPFQGKLFFAANDDNGRELWQTDGTSAGTTLVKDIFPGTQLDYYGNPVGNSSSPYHLTVANGLLFFAANDGVHGRELWETNGTVAGTVLVKDISAGPNGSNPANLTTVGNQLFFTADDGVHGIELWKTDGTSAGTTLVKDINPGAAGSNEAYAKTSFAAVNGLLLFTADDGVHGLELWRSDGTAGGTALVSDINPGPTGSLSTTKYTYQVNGTSDFAVVGQTLYFAADDGVHGRELWQSDGTAAGTTLVADINPGPGGAFGAAGQVITNVNGVLYFAAYDGTHGTEPWIIPATGSGPGPGVQSKSPVGPGSGQSAGSTRSFPPVDSSPGALLGPSTAPGIVSGAATAAGPVTTRIASLTRTAGVPLGPLFSWRRRIGLAETPPPWDRRSLTD